MTTFTDYWNSAWNEKKRKKAQETLKKHIERYPDTHKSILSSSRLDSCYFNQQEWEIVFKRFYKGMPYALVPIDCSKSPEYIQFMADIAYGLNYETIKAYEHERDLQEIEEAEEMELYYESDETFYSNLHRLHPRKGN